MRRTSDPNELRIAVSGGSMGGLFTGLALRAAGHEVAVFERSDVELRSRGAGIVAQPLMLDVLRDHGTTPEHITTTTSRREYLDRNGTVERGYEEAMTFTSWDAVYRCLRESFPDDRYHSGRTTAGVDVHDGTVTVRFEEGDAVEADLAVVAEGGRSATREALLPDVEPEDAGYVAWRGVTPEAAVRPGVREQFEDTFTFYQGPDGLILAYLIPGPDGETATGRRRLNWVWYDDLERAERARLLTDADGRQRTFSVAPGDLRVDVVDGLRTDVDERLPAVFADLVAGTDRPFVQTIYDLTVPEMAFGRVCLLGDAAFVARPHTAAGTAKAAADGVELAATLDGSDVVGSLRDWAASRLAAGRRLVARGQRMGDDYMD
ncbi:FAD binding domain-containing protein [Halomarina ordinaria]|uniref:FAD-dependent monooxygenase n=1 Tax=Halomarina ordinaria TaxID=3033939 RepID=A0ABD5UC48_9EURY|nr:FAD-dependent monooxygenase [Halomarina sp. PSRA2]